LQKDDITSLVGLGIVKIKLRFVVCVCELKHIFLVVESILKACGLWLDLELKSWEN
jgi:hypothetical protein